MIRNRLVNAIVQDIPADKMQLVLDAVQVLQDNLLPYLVDLGPEDPRGMTRMGPKSVDFVAKTVSYAVANLHLKPAFVDVDALSRSLALFGTLRSLQQPLQQIIDQVDDSIMVVGSEAYSGALAWYDGVQSASKLKVPGATTIADDLRQRFVRGRRAPKKAVPPGAGTGSGTDSGATDPSAS